MAKKRKKKRRRRLGPRFTREQKAEAVALLERGDVTAEQLAADLGVSSRSLQRWKKEREESEGATPLTSAEREELKRLRKQVKRQQQSIEILKKARAFMAKERG